MPKTHPYELFKAAARGDHVTVRKLLQARVPFNYRFDKDGKESPKGHDALSIAAKFGYVNVLADLLEAGANPNARYTDKRSTTVQIAVMENRTQAVHELIRHKADVNARDKDSHAPIDFANEVITRILENAGAKKKVVRDQTTFINNYNLLVERFKINGIDTLKPLNDLGVCDGLSKVYLFYNKQDRMEEFWFFIVFINSMNRAGMDAFADQCAKNNNMRLKLNKNDDVSYTFNKLLDFINAVHATSETQKITKYKSIGAHLDASNIVLCRESELLAHLSEFQVLHRDPAHGGSRFMTIESPGHLMALTVTVAGGQFYNPNNPDGDADCESESKFTTELLLAIPGTDPIVKLIIDDISYGDNNNFMDNWLAENSIILAKYKFLQILIDEYRGGMLARRDLASCLVGHLALLKNQEAIFTKLQTELESYLKRTPARNIISTTLNKQDIEMWTNKVTLQSQIESRGYVGILDALIKQGVVQNSSKSDDISSLYRAIYAKNPTRVLYLIGRGADINHVEPDGMTALHHAIYTRDVDMIILLLEYGANVNTRLIKDGCSPLQDALMLLSDSPKIEEIVTLMLKQGADVTAKNINGSSPLSFVQAMGLSKLENLMMRSPGSHGLFAQDKPVDKDLSEQNRDNLKPERQ